MAAGQDIGSQGGSMTSGRASWMGGGGGGGSRLTPRGPGAGFRSSGSGRLGSAGSGGLRASGSGALMHRSPSSSSDATSTAISPGMLPCDVVPDLADFFSFLLLVPF